MPFTYNPLSGKFDFYKASLINKGSAQGQMAFWDDTLKKWTSTETSELFWDDTNKRTGYGTANPDSQVHIQGLSGYDGVLHLSTSAFTDGGMYITGTSDNIGVFSAGTYYDRPASSWRAVSTEAAGFEMKDGGIKFRMNTGLTVGNTHELTDRVRFVLNGTNTRMGIGLGQNVDPSYAMHIKAQSGNGFLTFFTEDTDAIAGIALGDKNKEYQGQIQYDNSVDFMRLKAYNTEIITIDGINKRVGINNTTPTAGYALSIVGAQLQYGNLHIGTSAVNAFDAYVWGNVGIGTASPTDILTIVGNDTPTIRLQNTVGSYTGIDFFSSTGFGKFELYGKHMQFAAEGDLRFYYDTNKLGLHIEETNGHVGINTNAPNYGRLQVNVDLNDANTGVTLFNSGGTTARSWLSSSDVWLFTRGSTSTKGLAIDSAGNVGIGITSPTAKLHLPAGTATAGTAPFKLTAGTALTTPETGTIEFHNDRFYITNVATRRPISRSNDVITTTTTVENTTTETTVYTATVPANSLKVGNYLCLQMCGELTNDSASDDITLRLKIGSTTLETFNPAIGNVTDANWCVKSCLTVRSVGATGKLAFHGETCIDDDEECVNTEEITVDTTSAENITLTIEWDNAKAGNIFKIFQGITEWKN